MWDKYKVSLISGPLLQYMANLVALILLTSIADISYIDHLPICNDLSEETWTKKFNWTFGVKGDVCET